MTHRWWMGGTLAAAAGLVGLGLTRTDIPSVGPGSAAPWAVPVMTAIPAELQLLPGIGPVLADRVVRWRARQPEPVDPSDLLDIHGIGPRTLSGLLPWASWPTVEPVPDGERTPA